MSTLHAGYILQCKVTSTSSSGSMGLMVCVKWCRMVDSVPRWQLSLSWPIQSDHLSFGVETFSWQDTVHSWKAGPGEVMTVENLFIGIWMFDSWLCLCWVFEFCIFDLTWQFNWNLWLTSTSARGHGIFSALKMIIFWQLYHNLGNSEGIASFSVY